MNRTGFIVCQVAIFIATAVSIRLIFGETSQPNWALSTAYASLFIVPTYLARKHWHLIIPLAYAGALWAGAMYLRITDPNETKAFTDGGYMASFPWFYLSLGLMALALEVLYRFRSKGDITLGNFWLTYYAFAVAFFGVVYVALEGVGLAGDWTSIVSNLIFAVMVSYVGYSEIKGDDKTSSACEAETKFSKAA